jgi:putative transposase
MARPLRVHVPGAMYHVMSRGNARQEIFLDDEDYERFFHRLAITSARFKVRCRACCLMPNHYHLVLEPATLPLSRMMQQLNSSYSQWFNRRHDRVGHVLQGRFRSLVLDDESYLRRVVRYIVLNPVRARLVEDPSQWRWSSYNAHAYTLTEIGECVGRPASTVWRRIQRAAERLGVANCHQNEKIEI